MMHMNLQLGVLLLLSKTVIAPLPDYAAALMNIENGQRDNLIEMYFHKSFTSMEIVGALLTLHGISVCVNTVQNVLKKRGLRRRFVETADVLRSAILEVQRELLESGMSVGYRCMWQRLVRRGIRVKRETVAKIVKELDPDGVRIRKYKRLKRREYINPGPNFVWHVDGYDKLKLYGFPIHGAVDGYSRRVMWLEVCETNSIPAVIAKYFLDTVKSVQKLPCIVRADRGSENVHIERIQMFLRGDHDDEFSGPHSFLYGKSTGNQRIESWWGILRKQCVNFWMNLFKDMVSRGILNTDDKLNCLCLKYCFKDILQRDIQRTAMEWNDHRIRKTTKYETVSGKPNILYFSPQLSESENYGKPYNVEEVEQLIVSVNGCQPINSDAADFSELVCTMFGENKQPASVAEALDLYKSIMMQINAVVNA